MEQMLQVYPYCIFLLVFFISLSYCTCVAHFKKYIRSHGYGIVTSLLLNLVSTQLAASFLCMTSSIFLLIGDIQHKSLITLLNDGGTLWLVSASLLHIVGVTCLRVYSISYGDRFLKFVASSANVCLVIVKLWFVSIAMTSVAVMSGTLSTYVVFYSGITATGLFAVIIFFCTLGPQPKTAMGRATYTDMAFGTPIPPQFYRHRDMTSITGRQKTLCVLTGIVVFFVIFTIPVAAPQIYFNVHQQHMRVEMSLFLTLWALVGVMANLLWICCRMKDNLNEVTGLHSQWSLEGLGEQGINIVEHQGSDFPGTRNTNRDYERLETVRKQIM